VNFRSQLDTLQSRVQTFTDMLDRFSNREAYSNSLQRLSFVAALLATAAFVAFAQSPSQADAFTSAGLDPAYPASWLRAFFIADQITFALAMGVVMLVQLRMFFLPFEEGEHGRDFDMPREKYDRAVRRWRKHFLVLGILSAAVVSGFATFLFAGAAVYPHNHVLTDLLPVFSIFLIFLAVIAWEWKEATTRLSSFMSEIFPTWMDADSCPLYTGSCLEDRGRQTRRDSIASYLTRVYNMLSQHRLPCSEVFSSNSNMPGDTRV
jgi:hypothetical protein